MTGQTLSHYQIDAELGRGGMGVVYRATDTKLNRRVALKVLPAAALASPDDRARFVREAQSAAQLHHPNIATVFGIDEAVPEGEGRGESRLFIAMEYIEGETLRERAQKGPMKLKEAVSIAGQVAEALKVAHAKDIVHRDIKSANIMLTSDGVAKVLDFGLAKTNASTMLTRMGSTLGTVAYMSPEQARGEEVDGRSDLYSLGTVLYEMIAGRLPFAGDYEQAVIYGILNQDPEPLTAVRSGVPMQLEWIVSKLLAKEARHRYQTAGDLAADLETVDLAGSGFSRRSMRSAAAAPGPQRRTMVVVAAALVAGVTLGAAAMLLRPGPEPERKTVKRFDVPLPVDIQTGPVRIAPDGSRVAVADGGSKVTLIDLASGRHHPIERRGLLGVTFSPDGEQLLISSMEGLERSRADGSDRISVVQREGFTLGDWGPRGEIVYSTMGSFLVTLPPVGVADTIHVEPGQLIVPGRPLRDGRLSLQLMSLSDPAPTTWALDLATGDKQLVGDFADRVLPTGHLIVIHRPGNNHSLIPVDLDSFEPVGPSVPLQFLDQAQWDVANDGTLVYRPSPGDTDRRELRVLYANGTDQLVAPDVGADFDVTDSGDRVVTTLPASGDSERTEYHLAVIDVRSGLQTRIGGGELIRNARWHPSGREVVGQNEARDAIVSTPADRSEAPRMLLESVGDMGAVSWTADGSRMVSSNVSTDSGFGTGISMYDVQADSAWWVVDPSGLMFAPQVTADGRFVAYVAVVTENPVITILEIETGRNWSLPPQAEYRWSATGNGLEYQNGDSLMVSSVEFDPTFRVTGQPELVRVIPDLGSAKRLANGDIFYTRRIEADGEDQEEAPVLKVVINWFEEVKRLAPHPK